MKVVALVSGGKDSCYAMMRCIDYGHEIVALANLLPDDDSVDELDSYMYQTVGHQIVVSYAECMGLPLFRRRIQGTSRHKDLSYKVSLGDEVEDMYALLKEVKQQIPSITAVCSGAIASDYQRLRVESVCSRLNLVSLAYLWKQDQTLLLEEMVERGIVAIVIKVAAMGLNPAKHLGKEIAGLQKLLLQLKELYGVNVCGEGGEYESLTLDCPLFKNARIILDKFQIVLHSMDSIAPAGILHPLSFHLERKKVVPSIANNNEIFEISSEKKAIAQVVQESCTSNNVINTYSVESSSNLKERMLYISSANGSTFSVGCWISSSTSKDLQGDLAAVLRKVELHIAEDNLGWENVLYIHLYISDMTNFNLANEVYLKYVTEQKCYLGVPSRSTIELPLVQVGLGNAYIEVLVANDPNKRVLHVQSISSWAPSCIGPYSQATLHKEILFMAGQLGLDPPTMLLHSGGPAAELEKALENCEAVAKCFDCSTVSSSIFLVVYCSTLLTISDRTDIQHRMQKFLRNKTSVFRNGGMSDVPMPISLYILVPELPKGALLEIKPVLYVPDHREAIDFTTVSSPSHTEIPWNWDFGLFDSNDSCCQKFIVSGKICAVVISIIDDIVADICSVTNRNAADRHFSYSPENLQTISRFCVYLLHQTLLENNFTWSDLMSLRIYVASTFCGTIDMLSVTLSEAFAELAQMDDSIHVGKEPIFSLIPVLCAGRSTTMPDLITCELFASKL